MMGTQALADATLREVMEAGRLVLVVGRTSSSGGSDAIESAVDDFMLAATAFPTVAVSGGVQRFSRDALVKRLGDSPIQTVEGLDGSSIKHRLLVFDDWVGEGVVGLIAAGSARSLDGEFAQPFSTALGQSIRRLKPGAVVATDPTRLSRWTWGASQWLPALTACGGILVLQEGYRIDDLGPGAETRIFMGAQMAEAEAEAIAGRLCNGVRNATGQQRPAYDAMTYGHGSPPPPGFAVARLKSGTGVGDRIIFFDRPMNHPDEAHLATVLPEVRDGSGQRVDQVENVRLAIRLYADGVPRREIAAELRARKFSTPGLRSHRHDSSAHFTDSDADQLVLEALLANLPNYCDGVVRRRSGHPEVEDSEFEMVPEGGWGTPDEFRRALARREQAREAASRFRGAPKQTFTGLRVSVKTARGAEFEGVLMSAEERGCYRVRGGSRRQVIRHEALAETLAEALAAVGPVLVGRVFRPSARSRETVTRAEARLLEVASQISSLEVQREQLIDKVVAVEQQEALLGALNERLLAIEGALAEARESTRPMQEELAEARAALDRRVFGEMNVSGCLAAVAELSDPTSLEFRDAWLNSIDVISIAETPSGLRIVGRLVLRAGEATTVVPFAGEQRPKDDCPGGRSLGGVHRVVGFLRDGIPASSQEPKPSKPELGRTREFLGLRNPSRSWVVTVEDPTLLRLYLALLERPLESDAETSEATGVEVAVVRRARDILSARRGNRWRTGGNPLLSSVLQHLWIRSEVNVNELSARFDCPVPSMRTLLSDCARVRSHGRSGRRTLNACHCGSTAFGVLTIPEPSGTVCLGCWTDDQKLRWPQDEYGRYLSGRRSWAERGFSPTL